MGAIFSKPLVAGTIPRDGFEFGFPGASYQMVPIGESRPMSIMTDDQEWFLKKSTVSIGSLGMRDFQGGSVRTGSDLGRLIIPARSVIKFNLRGESAGETLLILQDAKGTISHTLRVSVKTRLQKRYAIRMVKDIRRKTSRLPEDAKAILREVAGLYREQANLDFQLAGEPEEILVAKDLKNPVFLDKELNDIIKATPAIAMDHWIYCIWNVEDSRKPNPAVGLTAGVRSFVDDGMSLGAFAATQLFGHEIGHALGLPDTSDSTDRLMFRGKSGGLKLVQSEIDAVNPTGVTRP